MRFLRTIIPRRFSLRKLMLITTIASVGVGVWYGKARQRIAALRAFSDLSLPGMNVLIVRRPPAFLQAIGITDVSPLFVEGVVSLEVQLYENGAYLGGGHHSVAEAQKLILEQRGLAKAAGACYFGLFTRNRGRFNKQGYQSSPAFDDREIILWNVFLNDHGIKHVSVSQN